MIDFLLNGLLFILVGLAASPYCRPGVAGRHFFGLVLHAALLSLVVIAIRIIWVFGTAYLPPLVQRKRPASASLAADCDCCLDRNAGRPFSGGGAGASADRVWKAGIPAARPADLFDFHRDFVYFGNAQGLELALANQGTWTFVTMAKKHAKKRQAHQQGTQAALDRLTELADEENLPAGDGRRHARALRCP